jgi:antitoxin MazE
MSETAKTRLAKWGGSLAVRIPKSVVGTARLREADEVMLAVRKDGAIVMTSARRKYPLDELVSRITARNRHDVTDWGTSLLDTEGE